VTPSEDQSGQYGTGYPGTGHDAFGGPGGGYAPGYPGYDNNAYQDSSYPDNGYQATSSGYRDEYAEAWNRRPGQANQIHEPEVDEGPLIRPYAMTGGRTRPRYQLAIEALVSTTAQADRAGSLLPEHQRIVLLCREVKSVAEVSALVPIPLGVARILVADLAEAGLVAIHQPAAATTTGGAPDVTLLERVLSGLRKL
jgi:hypothetical protein